MCWNGRDLEETLCIGVHFVYPPAQTLLLTGFLRELLFVALYRV